MSCWPAAVFLPWRGVGGITVFGKKPFNDEAKYTISIPTCPQSMSQRAGTIGRDANACSIREFDRDLLRPVRQRLLRNAWRNHRQQDMRRARGGCEDAVAGRARMTLRAFRLARIRVHVEMRKVAARYVEPQTVTAAE